MNLSASAIQAFKACPMRYYYKYVLGIVPAEDTDSQRQGTNWHKILEIANLQPGSPCPTCTKQGPISACPLCSEKLKMPDNIMDAVINYLNTVYKKRPINKIAEEWEIERIILLYSLIGYKWYYSNEQIGDPAQLKQEIYFKLPLISCAPRRKVCNMSLVGKIDKIYLDNYKIVEHKSTSKSLDPDSTYWNRLNLDTQTQLYAYAATQLYNTDFATVIYDVWHKPQIRPKKLTQSDSREFVKTGNYCGQEFKVRYDDLGMTGMQDRIVVNNAVAVDEPGAKEGTFSIRETPEMFGARLLQDIIQQPEFYFVRKEIPRTVADLKHFEGQLFNIYLNIKTAIDNNSWYENESQCEATFRCPYIHFCYNHIKCAPNNLPEGFRCIYDTQ